MAGLIQAFGTMLDARYLVQLLAATSSSLANDYTTTPAIADVDEVFKIASRAVVQVFL
jgi:hypothetical protein